jgi:hypothetical protein
MKKSVLFTATVLIAFSAAVAHAGAGTSRVHEAFKAKIEKGSKELEETKEKAATDQAAKARYEQEVDSMAKTLNAISGNTLADRDLKKVIGLVLINKVAVNGVDFSTGASLSSIVNAIAKADEVSRNINRNEVTSAADKALLAQKERAVKICAEFVVLAKNMTHAQTQEVGVFIKQLDLIPEMLTSMSAEDLKSHLDIMEKAVEAHNKNSQLKGDQAFAEALKTKYGQEYAQKLLEILGCIKA